VPGADLAGVFVYRTVDDVVALRDWVQRRELELGRAVRGAVVGGGLLGARGRRCAGRSRCRHDRRGVRAAPDGAAGGRRRWPGAAQDHQRMGVDVRLRSASESIDADADGRVAGLRLADQDDALPVDVVVFATGVRPRDELAGPAGLPTGPRGGFVVDEACRTEDPRVWAGR
jgi:nitrite reductase (NADH) large subunit